MDITYKNEIFSVRVVSDQGQPKAFVISSNSIPLDKENVRDISTSTARWLRADNGQLDVYSQQANGSFNHQPMEISTPHREDTRAVGENGELKENLSSQDVENRISQVKGQFEEAAAAQTAEQIRQQYKQDNGIE
jgi:hypothetical protein